MLVPEARIMTAPDRSPVRLKALRGLLRPAERVYVITALLVVSGPFLTVLARTAEADSAEGSSSAHRVLLPIYAVMGWIIISHLRGFLRAAARGLPILWLTALAIFSTVWSMEPDLTLRRSIAQLAPTAFGVVLASRFTTDELMRLVAWALGIGAVMSTIAALGMPEWGISSMEYGSAWRGLYGNKNSLGRAMSLAVIVFLLLAMDARQRRWVAWSWVGLCAALVVMSRSATSLLVAGAVVALVPLYRSLRLRFTAMAAAWAVAILLGGILLTVVLANAEPVFTALGRDATLTGRTELWAVVVANIAERPWLGYGFNAFWLGWSGASATVLSSVGWDTPHSHNGFLDLWLDLGFAGVLLFLVGFGVAARAALRCARSTHTAAGLWPLAFLSFTILANVTETGILRQHSLFWILYVAVLSSDPLVGVGASRSGETVPGQPPSGEARQAPRPAAALVGGRISPGVRRAYRWRGPRG